MRTSTAFNLFMESVVMATSRAPDEYAEWDTLGYPYHRAELLDHWALGRQAIKRDLDKVAQINELLPQAIASFDRGEREPGRTLMLKIYDLLPYPCRIR